MSVEVQEVQEDYLAHPARRVNLDVQETQDKDLRDHLGLQVRQVMEDQDLKETEETQALHPALEHIIPDHQDHQDHQDSLGLLGLKDQQVLLDREDTKVNQARQVCRAPQEALRECRLIVEDRGSLDHQVHQVNRDVLDILDYRELKGTLELLVLLALQEAPSQSRQVLLVLQVLLGLQASRALSLLPLRCGSTSVNI